MATRNYSPAYDILNEEAEHDLRSLEELVNDAMGAERSMTSASLPEGFTSEMVEESDFGFEAHKKYNDGTEITVQYNERSSISFNRPDSSSVEINVDIPYNITEHWDQKR